MSEKRYFKFTVEGQYIALHDAGSKTLKRYSASFTLPSQEAALSIICKHLLDDTLTKKYQDYIKFRTHAVTSMEVVGRSPDREVLSMDPDEMNREQLSDFCILKSLMIDPYKHGDLTHCREVVKAQWRLKRLAQKEKEEHKDAGAQKEVDALRELNDLGPEEQGIKVNVNAQKAAGPANAGPTAPPLNVPRETSQDAPPNPNRLPSTTAIPGENDDPLPPFVEDIVLAGESHGAGSDLIA